MIQMGQAGVFCKQGSHKGRSDALPQARRCYPFSPYIRWTRRQSCFGYLDDYCPKDGGIFPGTCRDAAGKDSSPIGLKQPGVRPTGKRYFPFLGSRVDRHLRFRLEI